MVPYHLTSDAESDLKEILRYTLEKWGRAQALRYAESLDRCFVEIATKSRKSRTLRHSHPALHVTRCEHHYVFYLRSERQPPQIIAVLHERMDMLQRLKDRLP